MIWSLNAQLQFVLSAFCASDLCGQLLPRAKREEKLWHVHDDMHTTVASIGGFTHAYFAHCTAYGYGSSPAI